MDDQRTIQLQALRERIERGEYEIDARAVADAIVDRLRLCGEPAPQVPSLLVLEPPPRGS
jgi:hypothetical protein